MSMHESPDNSTQCDPCEPALWRSTAASCFPEQRRRISAGEVRRILALAKVAPGAAVLDCFCGIGLHTAFLSRYGRVIGVDLCGEFLEEAKHRISELGNPDNVQLFQQDVRQFSENPPPGIGRFDLAIWMYTVLGYFSYDETVLCMSSINRKLLKPGGQLLLDVASPAYIRRTPFAEFGSTEGVIRRHIQVTGEGEEMRYEFEFTVTAAGCPTRTLNMSIDAYDAERITRLMTSSGFDEITLFGNLEGIPYREQAADRIVALATRTDSEREIPV